MGPRDLQVEPIETPRAPLARYQGMCLNTQGGRNAFDRELRRAASEDVESEAHRDLQGKQREKYGG